MKIRQIRLQNVKSYADENIEFNDGVNFISGVNGAGKTTIIESIGYALFNCKPLNISEFVRYGQRTGVITISFEANDGRLYRVVRKFGGVNSWLVFDEETDSEVNLHGAVDVVPWLKEVLGVEPEHDLSQLFEDVIGVGQGTFTTPFLETPSVRKLKFNKIFEVESYRDAYNRMRDVFRRVDEIINGLKVQRAEKEGYIKDFDMIRSGMEAMVPEIARLEKAKIDKAAEKEKREKERDALRDRERQITSITREICVGEERIKSLETSISKLDTDIGSALSSQGLVQKNTEGYLAYTSLKKEQEGLERLRRERDLLKDSLSECQQEYGACKGKADADSMAAKTEQEELEVGKKAAENALEGARKTETESAARLGEAEKLRKLSQKLHETVNAFEKCVSEAVKQNVRLAGGLDKWTSLDNSITASMERVSREAEIRARLDRLSELETQSSDAAGEKAGLLQKIETLKENLQKTGNGMCPFMDAPCGNIEGDLRTFFEEKLKAAGRELEGLELKAKALEAAIAGEAEARKDMLQLENDRAALEKLRQDEAKFSAEFQRSFRVLLTIGLKKAAASVGEQVVLLSGPHEMLSGRLEDNDFKDNLVSFTSSWDILEVTVMAAERPDISKVRELADMSQVMAERAEQLLDSTRHLDEGLGRAAEDEYNTRLSENVRDKRDTASLEKRLDELRQRFLRLGEKLEALKEMDKRLIQLDQKRQKLLEEMKAYDGLDKRMGETQEGLLQNQAAYDTYIKHQVEASRLENLKAEKLHQTQGLGQEKTVLAGMLEKLAGLSGEFSEEALKSAEALAESAGRELAVAESTLKERQSDLKELEDKLRQMERIRKEIEELGRKIESNEKIRETAGFIRNILNRAGERVSAVYREHLANEANRLYREVSRENVVLEWREDYEVFLVDVLNGRTRERCFRQLSGGEQMTAALAMRLGLLNQLSKAGIGFFDEPTTNLDGERRNNLAQILPQVTGSFDQLFVISHDDSFDSMTENIVQLRKDTGEGTKLL